MTHKERQELQEILVEYIENPRKMGGCILSIEDLFRRVHTRWSGFRYETRTVNVADEIVNRIANKYNVTIKQIQSRRRPKRLVQAREEIVLEMKEAGFSLAEIARALDKHASSIIYTLAKIRDRSND